MYYLVEFNSITFAKRVREKYRYGREYISIMHTPSSIANGTCSYSVRVKGDMVDRVVAAASDMGFKVKGIFREDGQGNYTPI